MENVKDWGRAFEDAADTLSGLGKVLGTFKIELDKQPFWLWWWFYYWPPFPSSYLWRRPRLESYKFWFRWHIYWPLQERIHNIRRRGGSA